MPEHSTFFAYQAHIAGTDYIAIPRQVGTEARVEIYPLHNPGIDDVTGAIVADGGKLIEASRLAVSRTGHEYSQIIDPGTLPEQVRAAFRRLAVAVLASNPAPVPYATIHLLSLPRRHLALLKRRGPSFACYYAAIFAAQSKRRNSTEFDTIDKYFICDKSLRSFSAFLPSLIFRRFA